MPTYSPFLIVFIPLCRFRFPSGVIFFLLEGLPVFLESLLLVMSVSFCMSEKVYFTFMFKRHEFQKYLNDFCLLSLEV